MIGFRGVAPCLAAADVGATAQWYAEHLDFQVDGFPADQPWSFAILRREAVTIMLQRAAMVEQSSGRTGAGFQPSRAAVAPTAAASMLPEDRAWSAYITVSGIRELFERLQTRMPIRKTLRQLPYGDWEFEVEDPNGCILVFSELLPES
ncbi:MAG: hypothetical protein ABI837_06845 [Acidobacteriota bacterium]